jgi:uncharacterized membrane protein
MRQLLLAVALGTLLTACLVWWELRHEGHIWEQEEGAVMIGLVAGMWLMIVVVCWVLMVLVIPGLLSHGLRFYQRLPARL